MEKELYYFVSDVHLGLEYNDPQKRERDFSTFLYNLPQNTKALYLLGDIFDFWYEYKDVIPRNFTRSLGALAWLVDRGVEVYFLIGNHDIWTFNYLQTEVGVKFLDQHSIINIKGKNFSLAHGDGLNKSDIAYKIMNSIFKSRFTQLLYSAVHPRWALLFGKTWSKSRKVAYQKRLERGMVKSPEIPKQVINFTTQFLQGNPEVNIDYFIFGHFHDKKQEKLLDKSDIYMLGNWIERRDYLLFDGEKLTFETFENRLKP